MSKELDLKIFVTTDVNPKRARAATRFEQYRDGMTPTEYAEKIGSATQAYRDITWDAEHGYIRLVPTSAADKVVGTSRRHQA